MSDSLLVQIRHIAPAAVSARLPVLSGEPACSFIRQRRLARPRHLQYVNSSFTDAAVSISPFWDGGLLAQYWLCLALQNSIPDSCHKASINSLNIASRHKSPSN